MIDIFNDKKYIISLEKRADRRATLFRQLENLNMKNYELFIGIDGNKIDYHGKYKKGQNGCKLSHLEIIKKAKEQNLKHIIIIEDDAEFTPGFTGKIREAMKQLPNNWQMFYFGAHNFRKLNMVSENIGKCVTTLSTVCYAINNSIYDTLIDELQKDEILDIAYNKLHQSIKAYCVFPNLVTQASGVSDIENIYVNYKNFYNKWQ